MKEENTFFYNESENSDFIDSQLESFDEFAESVITEAKINHMTNSEKLKAKKYRDSIAGQKAIAKHLKKASKAGYKVNKERSKVMKKVAAQRNEEFDFENQEMCESYLNSLDPEILASVDSIVEDIINFSEACNVDNEVPTKDPETGEELDEVKHMSAAAKAIAKRYRKSASGQRSIAKHLKKASKAGYKVNKERSKVMKKVAAQRNEEIEDDINLDESLYNDLSDLILSAALNSEEILEACKEEGCEVEACKKEACKEESEEGCEIEINYDDESLVKTAAEDNSVEIVSSEDGVYTVKGCCDNLEDFLEDLGIDSDIEDLLTDNDCNEAIKHMSAAAKAIAKRYRKSAAGKKALKKYAKKRAKAGYRPDRELSKKMKKVAAQRREAIEESLDEQFANFNSLFGSLNESETAELKAIAGNTISSLLESSEKAICEDLSNAYQTYINEELLPEMFDLFDNHYIKVIMNEHNEQIDEWLSETAKEVVEDLDSKKLIVKSHSAIQNEEFVENLLSLIKENLQILPEQEDYIDNANNQIQELNKKLQESNIEAIRLRDKLNESKRSEYVYKNMPSDLFESDKEKLLEYVETELSEAESFDEFTKYFDEAVNTIRMNNKNTMNEEQETVKETKQETSSLLDSILRIKN